MNGITRDSRPDMQQALHAVVSSDPPSRLDVSDKEGSCSNFSCERTTSEQMNSAAASACWKSTVFGRALRHVRRYGSRFGISGKTCLVVSRSVACKFLGSSDEVRLNIGIRAWTFS